MLRLHERQRAALLPPLGRIGVAAGRVRLPLRIGRPVLPPMPMRAPIGRQQLDRALRQPRDQIVGPPRRGMDVAIRDGELAGCRACRAALGRGPGRSCRLFHQPGLQQAGIGRPRVVDHDLAREVRRQPGRQRIGRRRTANAGSRSRTPASRRTACGPAAAAMPPPAHPTRAATTAAHCSRTISNGERSTQGISIRTPRQYLLSRHRCAGNQVKPDSSSTTFSVGCRLNTPSQTRLVSWV